MRTTCILIVCVLSFALAHAQTDNKTVQPRNKTVYGEMGGPGFLSINFDSRFSHKPTGLGIRAGLGYAPGVFGSALAVPVGINFLAGKDRHYFEAEGGASFIHFFGYDSGDWFKTEPSSVWIKYLYAGYRYKAPDGFTARIGFCPLFAEGGALPWIGISVGGSF